ncbi:hypothetical protein BN1110_06337 [bacterium YEK0313]|nr:hypothetical protein BN1110_06337 [bacterium YEK0313]
MSDTNPYRITGPALISFSGGRTSGFMLHQIITAHGGDLPEDVVVAFANTGKEREETLRFVHECGSRWGVHIYWLEWRDYKHAPYAEVGFNSASRKGEPFQALIDKKQRLPNWQERWCTQHLKILPLNGLAATFGWEAGSYTEVIGLRYDEGHRILKGMANADKYGRKCAYPLSRARVTKADVMAFWRAQDFDLGLEPWEGNCDLCFMKGRGIKKRIIQKRPEAAAWWSANESAQRGKQERGWFDRRDSIAGLAEEVRRNPGLFDPIDDEEFDAECGLICAGEAA